MEAILKRIKNATKPLVIITSNAHQERLLRAMHAQKIIKPVQFIVKKDLFQRVFFNLKPHALDMAAKHFNTDISIIEEQCSYIHKIEIDRLYHHHNLKQLKALKTYLIDQNLLQYHRFRDIQFENKTLIYYGTFYDAHLLQIITEIKQDQTVEHLSPPSQNQSMHLTAFEDKESEVRDIILRILELTKDGVSLDKIKLYDAPQAYHHTLKSFFRRYHIPLDLNQTTPLIALPFVQTFLSKLKQQPASSFHLALKTTFEQSALKHLSPFNRKVYDKLLQIANPLIEGDMTLEEGLKGLTYRLKRRRIKTVNQTGAVENLSYEQLDSENIHTLFVLGMAQGLRPQIKKDHDFLDETDKNTIDYPTVIAENKLEKLRYLEGLKLFKNVHFSYAKTIDNEPYEKSTLLTIIDPKQVEPLPIIAQTHSYRDDRIRVKNAYDQYQLYREQSQDLTALYPLFKDDIKIYDHRFKGLDKETLTRFLRKKRSVGVTAIENFYQCQFRFLLSHFLNLDTIDNPFYLDLGTLCHDLLEIEIENAELQDETLDKKITTLIKKRSYSKKTQVFFEHLKPTLKEAFYTIKQQETITPFDVYQRELALTKTYPLNQTFTLKGKIDKIFKKDKDSVLIDYKTGRTSLELKTAYHGIGAQLLFYALMYKNTVEDATIIGLYEQQLLGKNFDKKDNKTLERQIFDYYQMQGITLNNPEKLTDFNPQYESDNLIKGFHINKKDGRLSAVMKTFEPEDLERLTKHLDALLKKAFNEIEKGDFKINPKRIGKNNVSCQYCPFKDICYRDESDLETHPEFDHTELFKTLKAEVK